MNIVENARQLAFKYHEGQWYGIHPYTSHLEDVVKSLRNGKYSGDALFAAAWLHDILEDTECDRSTIREQCGERVLDAVLALTKEPDMGYEMYIYKVRLDPIALEVKRHDTLCNLTASVMSGEKGRIKKYARQIQLLVEE